MKDLVWYALFIFALVGGAEIAEDYRAERCTDHGGAWIREPGCKSDWCDRSPKKANK